MEVWLIRSMAELSPKDEEVGINEKAVLGSQSSTMQSGARMERLGMLSSRWAQAQGQASSFCLADTSWRICSGQGAKHKGTQEMGALRSSQCNRDGGT